MSRSFLHVREAGVGETALLFVHGFACDDQDWAAQMAGLSSSFRCIALDLPGHGASSLPEQATLAALGAAVNRARQESGAQRVILVGHSLGCKVIREAYVQSPAGVAGLVFIEGAFYEADRETLIRRASEAIDRAGFAAYARDHFGAMFTPASDTGLRESVLARAGRLDAAYGRALYLDAVGWDPLRGKDTLRRIDVPVLVLQSTGVDSNFQRVMLRPGMTTSFMDAVASLVPGSEARVVAGCGHFAHVKAADEVNREIRRFAGRLAGVAA